VDNAFEVEIDNNKLYPRKQKTPTQTMSVDIVSAMTATTPIVSTTAHTTHHVHTPLASICCGFVLHHHAEQQVAYMTNNLHWKSKKK